MRNAYALLGVGFIIVFGGAFVLFDTTQVPADVSGEVLLDVTQEKNMGMKLHSTAFTEGGMIPAKYTCSGENIHPPLSFEGVPAGTQSLVLVMDDPDIPQEVQTMMGIEKFNHWVLYNIPADTQVVEEGSEVGSYGLNTKGESSYTGPCPPTEYQPTTHRYVFRLYALPKILEFQTMPTLNEVEDTAKKDSLGSAELIGMYSQVSH